MVGLAPAELLRLGLGLGLAAGVAQAEATGNCSGRQTFASAGQFKRRQPRAMGDRSGLLSSAITFLRDPSTATSPLGQRVAFLESKGLSPQEIEHALSVASASAPGPSQGFGGQHAGSGLRRGVGGREMREFEKDWRDWFIMAVVGGAVGWLGWRLTQKFLLPHLQPPSQTDLEAAQSALDAKYDEASDLLRSLQASTDSLATSLEEQKAAVEAELAEVKAALEQVRQGENDRNKQMQNVTNQVDDIAKSLPQMIDKQATAQTNSLTELQTELKSLKSLIVARRPTTSPSTPTATTPLASPAPDAMLNSNSNSNGVASPFPARPFGGRAPGIPAWQRQPPATPPPAPSSTAAATETKHDPSGSAVLVDREDAGANKEDADGSAAGVASGESSSVHSAEE